MELVLRKSLQIVTLVLIVVLAAAFKPTKPVARTQAPPDLQLEGGRRLDAQEFLAGHKLSPGQRLG